MDKGGGGGATSSPPYSIFLNRGIDMDIFRSTDQITALVLAILGLMMLVFWIPNDIDTGLVEKFRRQIFIGDALIPTIAASAILLCSCLLFISGLRNKTNKSLQVNPLDREGLGFLLVVAAIITFSIVVMFFLGPLAVAVFEDESSYRIMRDTVPYKYLGFLVGGSSLMIGLIRLIEGSIRPQRVALAVATVVLLIVVFDVPFDTLLLPPNGDW
ncbi:MAG: hypothetical protein GY763_06325 [Gammaproteobacteria bacterium]|nr:hypothetical protein [Gammaproteobacteria bacterium]